MDKYITQLRTYLTEKEFTGLDPECDSLLETLYVYYNPSNSADADKVKAAEKALEPLYKDLSFEDANRHFEIISNLCIAYERSAFLSGVRIGARLMSELNESSAVI